MPLDGYTLNFLVHELNESLSGSRVDKIHQPNKSELNISLRGANLRGVSLILSSDASLPFIASGSTKGKNPVQPPMFTMLLRKHLQGAKLERIRQHGLERVVLIDFLTGNEMGDELYLSLIIEIMGKHSNIILVETDTFKIIDSIKRVPEFLSSVRPVLPALNYTFLPSTKVCITTLSTHTSSNDVCASGEAEKNFHIKSISEAFENAVSNAKSDSVDMRKIVYGYYEGFSPGLSNYLLHKAEVECWFEICNFRHDTALSIAQKIADAVVLLKDDILNRNYSPSLLIDKETKYVDDFSVFSDYFDVCADYSANRMIITQSPSMNDCIVEYYIGRSAKLQLKNRSQNIRKIVMQRLSLLDNKLFKLNDELRNAEDCDYLKKCGELIIANMYAVKKGMTGIEVADLYSSDGGKTEIKLDPMLTPNENSQSYFKRYQKQRGAIALIEEQIAEASSEIAYLENVIVGIDNSEDAANIEEISLELLYAGIVKKSLLQGSKSGGKPKKSKSLKTAYLKYQLSSGLLAFAGKNNLQNDRLTLKESSNSDMWFHTKNIPGSHVVVKSDGSDISGEDIAEAAMIAAWNSKGRMSGKVPVDYTLVKHVKKMSGAKPGMVIYTHNKTIYASGEEHIVEKMRV